MAKGTLRWWGHAFFEYVTEEGKVILIDPWTKENGNPFCPVDNDAFDKVDLVLVSHDHFDHVGSVVPICKRSGALLGGMVQTVQRLAEAGVDPAKVVNEGAGFNIGGGVDLGWCEVLAVQAFHSSDTACPSGLVIKTPDGTSIYHAGDTGLFGDMELIGRMTPLDVAILPIGGVFTMGPDQASEAVALLKPRIAVPMHFGSFSVLVDTADEFVSLCGKKSPEVEVVVLTPREAAALG